eukprot:c48321_g1_i1 orf=2-361(-)
MGSIIRAASSRLPKGTRGITGSPYRLAVPAAKSLPSRSGFFSWLLGEKRPNVPPLYEPLAGINPLPSLPDYVKPAETQITSLPNGLKIASENTAGSTVTVGLYVDCGSIYETALNQGSTH